MENVDVLFNKLDGAKKLTELFGWADGDVLKIVVSSLRQFNELPIETVK